MTRTVIRLEKSGKSVSVTLDRAPMLFDPNSWKVNLQKFVGVTLVERGQELLSLLIKREPVKTVLGSAFRLPVNSPPSPLYFHIRALAADPIPWEQLHVKDIGFCALDARWPIGRIAGRVDAVRGRAFKPPLRVVAVLSAAGRDGSEQLQALRAAVQNAGMPVRLHVISGDEALLAAATGPDVTSELIAGTAPELCTQITEAKPHVLHILCHGGAEAGVRLLSFGRIDDFDAGRDDGRLRLPVSDLVAALEACDPWLVVLAACETAGAADVANGRALAHEMVEQGVTAVIGMRRLVDLTDTNRFCEHLYPGVLAEIHKAVQPLNEGEAGERTIDWAVTLTNPRKVMSNGDPAAADSWLDPVLYAQMEDLRIYPPSQQLSPEEYAELQGRLDKFRAFLAAQDPATLAPEVKAEVQELIDDAEAKLASGGN